MPENILCNVEYFSLTLHPIVVDIRIKCCDLAADVKLYGGAEPPLGMSLL